MSIKSNKISEVTHSIADRFHTFFLDVKLDGKSMCNCFIYTLFLPFICSDFISYSTCLKWGDFHLGHGVKTFVYSNFICILYSFYCHFILPSVWAITSGPKCTAHLGTRCHSQHVYVYSRRRPFSFQCFNVKICTKRLFIQRITTIKGHGDCGNTV